MLKSSSSFFMRGSPCASRESVTRSFIVRVFDVRVFRTFRQKNAF
jgi:hypothetical protein